MCFMFVAWEDGGVLRHAPLRCILSTGGVAGPGQRGESSLVWPCGFQHSSRAGGWAASFPSAAVVIQLYTLVSTLVLNQMVFQKENYHSLSL